MDETIRIKKWEEVIKAKRKELIEKCYPDVEKAKTKLALWTQENNPWGKI